MQTLLKCGLKQLEKPVARLKEENMDVADNWNCAPCESSIWMVVLLKNMLLR